jgi:hypothetical protein
MSDVPVEPDEDEAAGGEVPSFPEEDTSELDPRLYDQDETD